MYVYMVNIKKFAGHLRGVSASKRARLAFGLAQSGAFSLAAAIKLAGVSAGYVAMLSKASPDERAAIASGELNLATLHNKKWGQCTFAEAKRLIVNRIGVDLAYAVLDAYTAPRFVVAAE
jgi:hypothetical protein